MATTSNLQPDGPPPMFIGIYNAERRRDAGDTATASAAAYAASDHGHLAVVEAMSCGNFCIGSNISGNRNWITDSINGRLVPLYEPQKIAKTIIDVKNNYDVYQEKAMPINEEIVNTRGNWNSNMNSALSMYKTLIHKK